MKKRKEPVLPESRPKSKKGRPPAGHDTVILTIRIERGIRERLRRVAEADRRASGTLAAILIEQGLDRIEERNSR